MLNVIVADMAATLDFYQRLGIAVPGDPAAAHVQLKMPGSAWSWTRPSRPGCGTPAGAPTRPAPGWSSGSCWPAGRRSMTATRR